MKATREHSELCDLVAWIQQQASEIELPADERSMLGVGCLDVALEHMASIALLHSNQLYGSELALLRCETEAVVRGLWLLHCATDADLERFKRGKVKQEFQELVSDVEQRVGHDQGVLSRLKKQAWPAMNGFTHTGFIQVTRRHTPGFVTENYDEAELAQALDAAGALGLLAAGQLISLSTSSERVPLVIQRMEAYASQRAEA